MQFVAGFAHSSSSLSEKPLSVGWPDGWLRASMHILCMYAYNVSNAAKRDVDEAHATAQLVMGSVWHSRW